MQKIKSVCPECGKRNDFYLSTNAEQLAEFETQLENDSQDFGLNHTVEDFKARPNQNAICPECLQNPIECPCGCDYYIRDSRNWNEIRTIIDSYNRPVRKLC